MPGTELIRARAVSRRFGKLEALSGVSLHIDAGETVALVGESGSGKTTLGRLVLGLDRPDGGQILYQGTDIARPPAQFRREVQVVFQDSSAALNPRRKIWSSIAVPLRHHLRLDRAACRAGADALLERVGLPPAQFRDRLPHELSGGQRQRVGIARAIASRPRLIVADEPVSALDVSIRAEVLRLLRDIKRQDGMASLFITHDLGVVRAVADRLIVLYRGVVMEQGPARAVMRDPRHPYTAALLASRPVAAGAPLPGCRYRGACPIAQPICAEPPALRPAGAGEAACHFSDRSSMHPDLDDPALRDRAVAAARGRAPFDWLIRGGQVADMATGELREADVGLVGPLIASVHPPGSRADAAHTIEVAGKIVAPGLIDMHLHIESSMITPRRYAEVVVPQGTTTLCWDPHEVGNVLGLDGVRWAVAASRDLPLRVLVLAPSCVPSAPGLERAGAVFEAAEMAEMLSWPEVAGVAEVMDMRGVLERSPHMAGIVAAGLAGGKLVCGHARGLAGADLHAFAAAGIESDHEITDGDDLLAKLRAGFTVELRGSHPQVLPGAVAALLALPAVPQTLTLCTDDIFPDDLVADGGIIHLLRRLVALGLPGLAALRLATLNAAQRLGRRDLGLVAPGRRADLLVLSDLTALGVAEVFASGIHVASGGSLLVTLRDDPVALPGDTMHVPTFDAADFRLAAPGPTARLRTVDQPRFTAWGEAEARVADGAVVLPDDALWMAVIHRHGLAPATPVMGVLRGWGRWHGALATTVAHDSHNLVVLGTDAPSLAAAANAVAGVGGGMAVASDGVVRAVLPLPVCGLISDAPAADVAAALRMLRAAAELVADWLPPLRTFKAVGGASLACNPGPHVTDMGIGDGSTGALFASALVA